MFRASLFVVFVAIVHGTSAFLGSIVGRRTPGRPFTPSRDASTPPDSTIVGCDAVHSIPATALFQSPALQPQEENAAGTLLDIAPSTSSPMHFRAIQAIAEALSTVTRAIKDDDDDPYEVMSHIGSVTQRITHKAKLQDPEESQVLGGRVVAILTRLELLEDQLQGQAETLVRDYGYTSQQVVEYLGIPAAELMGEPGNSTQVVRRAESLLAWFLETIEGPGLQANNVVVPCMEVDFLDYDRYQALMAGRQDCHATKMAVLQETLNEIF